MDENLNFLIWTAEADQLPFFPTASDIENVIDHAPENAIGSSEYLYLMGFLDAQTIVMNHPAAGDSPGHWGQGVRDWRTLASVFCKTTGDKT